MAYVEPNVAVFPTLHMPVHSDWQQKYTHVHAHAVSLVKSVCSSQAGPLQQSLGVRGAICQWKTISGEWSVPLVLMSTAGSLCSQQQNAKGHQRLKATHNRVIFIHRSRNTYGPRTPLLMFTFIAASNVPYAHTDAITHWQMDRPWYLTHTHPFLIPFKQSISLHIIPSIEKSSW